MFHHGYIVPTRSYLRSEFGSFSDSSLCRDRVTPFVRTDPHFEIVLQQFRNRSATGETPPNDLAKQNSARRVTEPKQDAGKISETAAQLFKNAGQVDDASVIWLTRAIALLYYQKKKPKGLCPYLHASFEMRYPISRVSIFLSS